MAYRARRNSVVRKIIVTGSGRCGTGFMARVLTESGVACSHEGVFTPFGVHRSRRNWQADSSWMAVPHLSTHRDCLRVLVYRHPLDVINSFVGIGFFDEPSPYLTFMTRKLSLLDNWRMSPFEKACQHYVAWNLLALPEADIVTPIADMNWGALVEAHPALCAGHVRNAVDNVGNAYNHRERADIDPSLIPEEVWFTYKELEKRSESHR